MRIAKLTKIYKLLRRFRKDVLGYMLVRPSLKSKYVSYLVELLKANRKSWWERSKRYIYRLDLVNPLKRFKRMKRWFLTKQLILFMYPFFSIKQFRFLGKKAWTKEGSLESTFIRFVEGSVIGMLYRMQVLSNMFDLHKFIIQGNVCIDDKIITYPKRILNFGEILKILFDAQLPLRLNLLNRVFLRRHRFNVPRFMYLNYKLFFGFWFRDAKKNWFSI